MKYFLAVFLVLNFTLTFANGEDHDDHGGAEEKEAIKLSDLAVKNFEIKIQKIIPVHGKAEVPVEAIVKSEDKNQIFILHEGKYESREVRIVNRTSSGVTVDPFGEAEDVVISGVNYLKVVEMSHGEEGGGGHGH